MCVLSMWLQMYMIKLDDIGSLQAYTLLYSNCVPLSKGIHTAVQYLKGFAFYSKSMEFFKIITSYLGNENIWAQISSSNA